MADALERMILEKRAERDDLRRRAEVLDAEIAALEMAAQLRPAPKSGQNSKRAQTGGGRKQGDISHTWREILQDMYAYGEPLDYDGIARIAEMRGNELAIASVRDRVRNLVKTDLLTGNPKSGFSVTQDAVERFGFTKENEGSAEPSEANTGSAGGASGVLNLQPSPTREQDQRGNPNVDPFVIGRAGN